MENTREPRKWEGAFLDALRAGESIAQAARVVNINRTTPAAHAKLDPRFAAEMAAARAAPRNGNRAARGSQRKLPVKIELFLARLAETSNVAAAAEGAELTTATIYRLRREDPRFAKRWFAALAEGYDNLEMELLGRLRARDAGESDKGKFDTAAALRCLAAHRESVAREKGRRALADEVATIAAINAKIDQLRLNGEAGAKAIRDARAERLRTRVARARKEGGDGA